MKNILMCKPTFFDVNYIINPWMNGNINTVNQEKASRQWINLFTALSNYTNVYLIQPVNNLPDMVFTANAGFVQGDNFIVSNFLHEERKQEELHSEEYFGALQYNVSRVTYNYEGQGDHLTDTKNRHWMGSGFRTASKAAIDLEKILDTNIHVLELVDPRWYHLDTCFCPLPNGEIYWYPNAFSKASQDIILNSFDTHIFAHDNDALKFSCNSVCLGYDIFMPYNEYGPSSLSRLGYRIHQFELDEFIKSGGAAKCLTLLF